MSTITVVDNNQQQIRELQNEITQLRNETKISKLKIWAKQFRAEVDVTTFVESFFVITKNVSASRKKFMFDNDAITKSIVIFHKLFKFDKLKNYKSFFEKKHRHWMRDAKLTFIKNLNYFSNNRTKILWCMFFLISDSQAQWFSHIDNDENLNDVIFDDFENFLLNLIVDSVNRRLNVYKRWKNVKQNSNQKVSIFKIYLKNLKNHLLEFEKIHKTFIFFVKFRFEFKQKILNIDNVSNTRKNILSVVIMQKKNLKRQRENNDNSNFNQNRNDEKFKNFESDKFQQNNQNQQQQFRQINQFKQKLFTRVINKRFRKFDNNKVLFKVECYNCDKKNILNSIVLN